MPHPWLRCECFRELRLRAAVFLHDWGVEAVGRGQYRQEITPVRLRHRALTIWARIVADEGTVGAARH